MRIAWRVFAVLFNMMWVGVVVAEPEMDRELYNEARRAIRAHFQAIARIPPYGQPEYETRKAFADEQVGEVRKYLRMRDPATWKALEDELKVRPRSLRDERFFFSHEPYVLMATRGNPEHGRPTMNRILAGDSITLYDKANLLQIASDFRLPLYWIDDEVYVNILWKLLDMPEFFFYRVKVVPGDDTQNRYWTYRYCDFAVHMLLGRYNPKPLQGIAQAHDEDVTLEALDEAVVQAKAWIAARRARHAARVKLLELAADHRTMQIDGEQMTQWLTLWRSLNDDHRRYHWNDMQALMRLCLQQIHDHEQSGDEALADHQRQVQDAIVTALGDLFKNAGHPLSAPEGATRHRMDDAVTWLQGAIRSLREDDWQYHQRTDLEIFVNWVRQTADAIKASKPG